MNEAVILETSASIAWITINRPDALNAINDEVRRLLPAAIRTAEANSEAHVIVVRGAGPRAFCVGADIKEFATVDAPVAYRQSRVYDNWVGALDEARKPIIASIHGHCLGGGFEIALACDLRIAARNAIFGFPETGLGIITGAGGSQRIARILGMGLALDLMLTGERINAERALNIGLISRITEPNGLAEHTRQLAEKIAAKPLLATMFAKEAVRRGRELELFAGLRLEADLLTHLINTEDRLEAARAFREKRVPRFQGK